MSDDQHFSASYQHETKGRTLLGCFVLVFFSLIGCVAVAIFPPLALILMPWLGWCFWCFATDKRWRVEVGNGVVAWDSCLPWGGKQSIPASDIRAVEINLDAKYEVDLVTKFGYRKRVPIPSSDAADAFVRAIEAEWPAIPIVREHRGTT